MLSFIDEESYETDDEEEFTGERVTAKEFAKRHFDTSKAGLQLMSLELVEPTELVVLDKASRELGESLLTSDKAGAERSEAACRKAAAVLREARGGSEKSRDEHKPPSAASRKLQSWRPDFSNGRVPPVRLPRKAKPRSAASEEEQGAPPEVETEQLVELESCTESEPPSEILERKNLGDAAACRGDFRGGLTAYEQCLAMAGTPDEDSMDGEIQSKFDCNLDASLHATIFCNAALCTLKLAGMQPTIGHALRMMRRTLRLCDFAVGLDFANSKAHYRRGCALEALERYEEASQAYERASRFESGDPLINEAFDRSCRYIEAEMDPKMVGDAKAHLQRLQKMKDHVKRPSGLPRPLGRRPKRPAAACLLSACIGCRADVGSAGRFVRPCGHGPFCIDCQEWIAREGRGLELCPACRRQPRVHPGLGVVEEWTADEIPELDLKKGPRSVLGRLREESAPVRDGAMETCGIETESSASRFSDAEARGVSLVIESKDSEHVQMGSGSATSAKDICLGALD